MSIGTNLGAVTIVFLVFKAFNERSRVPDELRNKLTEHASVTSRSIQRQYEED